MSWFHIFFLMNLLSRELSPPKLMFPLSPSSCKNEKDEKLVNAFFFFLFCFLCQCFVPGLEPLLFICLWERMMMGDSKERMCFCNDTRLTALKLKSLFNFLAEFGKQQRKFLHIPVPPCLQMVWGNCSQTETAGYPPWSGLIWDL